MQERNIEVKMWQAKHIKCTWWS